MPRPDVLPPLDHPLHAEILLDSEYLPDLASVMNHLAGRRLKLSDAEWTTMPTGAHRPISGGEIRIEYCPTTLSPAALAASIEDASTWWDAGAVAAHTHMLSVIVSSSTQSAAMTARLLVRFTAAILDTAARWSVAPVAVRWSDGRLLPPGFVQQQAGTEPALGVLVGFHVGKPDSGLALYTTGLGALGLTDIEVEAFDGELEAAAGVVKHWMVRLVTEGPGVIVPGTTIGSNPTDRARVELATSALTGDPVLRFSFGAEPPEAADPPGERVTCPECGKQVTALVMRLGPVVMMVKCPACGAGPVALLTQMMEAFGGGGEVTITLETTDGVALARVLSEHDPRFPSIIEASDFLRPHYDGRRAVLKLPRMIAGVLSAAIGREYPEITIRSDEALGVMGAPSEVPVFHAATNDAAMQAAIAEARRTVPGFLARLAAPQPGDGSFTVKVRFEDPSVNKTEHMWLDDLRHENGEFVGRLKATPQLVRNTTHGQEVRVAPGEISDWGFSNGDALHGNYTLRVMLESLPVRLRESLRQRLVPL